MGDRPHGCRRPSVPRQKDLFLSDKRYSVTMAIKKKLYVYISNPMPSRAKFNGQTYDLAQLANRLATGRDTVPHTGRRFTSTELQIVRAQGKHKPMRHSPTATTSTNKRSSNFQNYLDAVDILDLVPSYDSADPGAWEEYASRRVSMAKHLRRGAKKELRKRRPSSSSQSVNQPSSSSSSLQNYRDMVNIGSELSHSSGNSYLARREALAKKKQKEAKKARPSWSSQSMNQPSSSSLQNYRDMVNIGSELSHSSGNSYLARREALAKKKQKEAKKARRH